jgi:glucans biosynthesis protein C
MSVEMNTAPESSQSVQRIYFIDNLRVFLTMLVVSHHAIITYSGVGGWYYHEGRQDDVTKILGAMFTGVNQAFFMAFFFAIAAYFTVPSLEKKGAGRFIKDRFIRLGIPIIAYDMLINPAINYVMGVKFGSLRMSYPAYFIEYLKHYNSIATGPLWFLLALLVFSLVYAAIWSISGRRKIGARPGKTFPGTGALIAFCFICGAAAFTIRLWMRVGSEIELVNFQIPYFLLYAALFAAGVAAYRGNWFLAIAERTGMRWFAAAHVFILMMPVIMILGGALQGKQEDFTGGMHYQALAYAMWEPFVCVGMCAGLTVIFRKRFNKSGPIQRFLSRNAYTVYIIHAPVLVFVALAMRPLMLYPLLKFVVLIFIVIPICYALAHVIRKMPFTDRVL